MEHVGSKFYLNFFKYSMVEIFLLPHPAGVHTCACHVTSLLFSEGDNSGLKGEGGGGVVGDRISELRGCPSSRLQGSIAEFGFT